MGCEGNLTIERVTDGLHLLDLEKDPVFRVTEPVCVLPLYAEPIGAPVVWVNLAASSDELECFLRGNTSCVRTVALFGERSRWPVFGVVVVLQAAVYSGLWLEWESRAPGAEPLAKLREAWNKITPGYWLVTDYHESGNGDDNRYWGFRPSGVKTADKVAWEIWT